MTRFVDKSLPSRFYAAEPKVTQLKDGEKLTTNYYGVVPLRIVGDECTRDEFIAKLKHYTLPEETIDDSEETIKFIGELVRM